MRAAAGLPPKTAEPDPAAAGSSREAHADDVAEEPDLSCLNPSTQNLDMDVDGEADFSTTRAT